ncbi:hypothetical protein HYU40_05205 [Candidatus Woesearchaeota archaeon]|nr:hypothetical protein [Candidatus Woesearchaeota archaeon]
MQKETKKKVAVFFIGLALVSILTAAGSLAFFSASDMLAIIKNVFITDAIFIALYVAWVRLHKGYETIYKSGLELEQEK